MKFTKMTKSYVECVRNYIIRRKLLHYQARGVYYIIRQTLLHYQAASLLYYRVMLLHYQAVITLSGDFIILLVVLSGSVTSEIETGPTLNRDSPIHVGYTVESQVLATNIPCLP